jgi:hypothetical protein
MWTLIYAFLVGGIVFFFNPASALAEDRAVNINIGGRGGGVDSASVQEVRKVIGHAFTSGAADTVYVYIPRKGALFREGGASICVEGGFGSTPQTFNDFVKQLRSIHPPGGTFYNVELTADCKPIEPTQPLTCGGIQGKQCPDADQYCDFGAGQCKTADAQGACRPKPKICPHLIQPVCGCNGETYNNSCDAARAGVSVDYPGECKR